MNYRKKYPKAKRYYKQLLQKVLDFKLDLNEGSWFNLWHTHPDWTGYGNRSPKHRRLHLIALFSIFQKIQAQVADYQGQFQTWLLIVPSDSADDAVYFHTPNPDSEYPFSFDFLKWEVEAPEILKEFIIPNTMQIGECFFEGTVQYWVKWR